MKLNYAALLAVARSAVFVAAAIAALMYGSSMMVRAFHVNDAAPWIFVLVGVVAVAGGLALLALAAILLPGRGAR